MNDPIYLRRLESRVTLVRAAFCAGLLAAWATGSLPTQETSGAVLRALGPVLALGTLAIAFAARGLRGDRARTRLGVTAFLFDVSIAAVAALAAGEQIAIAFVLVMIPIEAALRYGLRPSIVVAIGVSLLFGAVWWDSPATIALVGGVCLGTAWVVGSAVQIWVEKQRFLERQTAQLIEHDRLRDRNVAITSHEIRSPLTAVIAATDVLKRKGDEIEPAKRDRLLEIMSQQGRQLARLVDDLMISSELQAGELLITIEMSDLESAVQRGLEGAAPKRRAHQLEVFVDPIRCEIDEYRVAQILRNLIENAYKYTPDRSRVTVSGHATDEGIELEVADDGPGIPLEKRDLLFEAFRRMEETSAGKEGVGLGLFVVSQLAAAMDALIDLASSTRGTTFTIRIPCRVETIEHRRMGVISGENAIDKEA
ncbi:MAG TPA: ATP-binding protein [Actinomycetota bacterium]|nr:ATP-binding protein [Actinomycetota bacterium]